MHEEPLAPILASPDVREKPSSRPSNGLEIEIAE
jgi:hypothetical protein